MAFLEPGALAQCLALVLVVGVLQLPPLLSLAGAPSAGGGESPVIFLGLGLGMIGIGVMG